MSNTEKIDEFKKRINTVKNQLYKDLILYDADHSPKDLTPLNEYIFYFLKIMQFWKDLFYTKYANPIVVPKKIEAIVSENTKWIEENIIGADDQTRTMALYELQKNCERSPLIFNKDE